MMPPAKITDMQGRLRALVYERYKHTNIVPLVDGIAARFQVLENSLFSLFALFSIDDSEGAQLDRLGRLVGYQRAGLDDATYRLYLKAEVLVNHSNGTPDQLLMIFIAMFTSATAPPVYTPGGNASFVIRTAPTLTAAQAGAALVVLGRSEGSGKRGLLMWQAADDADTFICSDTSFELDTNRGCGDSGDPTIGGQLAGIMQA